MSRKERGKRKPNRTPEAGKTGTDGYLSNFPRYHLSPIRTTSACRDWTKGTDRTVPLIFGLLIFYSGAYWPVIAFKTQ
jgi:hypothetical protein